MVEFIIDPEFRDKIPAMPQEDFDGLRADIIRDGYVRDPLVVWEEENILLDGHHRWRIISENREELGGKFKVDYKSFPDRWAAIAWICANQLHKHNMNELQRMKLIQEEYEARKHTVGAADGFRGNQYTKVVGGEISHQPTADKTPKVRKEIAEEHTGKPVGLAPRTAGERGQGAWIEPCHRPNQHSDGRCGVMKYLATASAFLLGNEVLSLLTLIVMALMFFGDILREADRRREIR